MELSCQALRTTHQAREARLHLDAVYSNKENITFDLEFCLNSQEEMRTEARRKNLLILILHYLIKEGYVDAANALEQETKLGLRGFEVCDNIDLETILMEYESYYFVKFQSILKLPKRSWTLNSDGADTLDQSDFGLSISGISKTGGDSSHPRKVGGNLGQIIDFHRMIHDAVRVSPDGIPLNSLNCDPDPSERLLKPLSAFIGMTGEMRELAMVVSKDIYLHKPNVKWDDIIGLDAAKRLVKEAVVYPIKVLFELARYHAPSTIFLDELESVMSQRGTAPGELDSAMLRRLEKRILVDLPSQGARRVMIQHWLPPLSSSGGVELRTDLDYSLLSQETNGYSGSDIKLVCKEAAMRPVRKIFDALENHQPGNSNLAMIQLDTITTADFLDVITHTKPSAKNLSQKYLAWQREFESV
ncbi:hypothetical protein DUI87_06685 [Hirundo rustica rustica]|uniref:AAA ATPase AAA+ lid domain-containing protein n=1 Tax=Hirundo rustica rustica TaxID=333673 RepID=A0A3M0KSV0_HIRRU|nr:hypothetical protein DUI87_06685 [Hirundo rustica rustica]